MDNQFLPMAVHEEYARRMEDEHRRQNARISDLEQTVKDSGKGDNTGRPDHVGGVEKVSGDTITVIEGNYSNSAKRRTLPVNGRYIRGYIVPKYDSEPATVEESAEVCKVGLRELKNGCTGIDVRALQTLLIGYGYSCGAFGADGDFGQATDGAAKRFQEDNSLEPDGIVGVKTWCKLLGSK